MNIFWENWESKSTNRSEKSESDQSELQLYPNPTSDAITITWDELPIQDWTFTLYDALGRLAHTSVHDKKSISTKVDLAHLPAGSYNYFIFSESEIIRISTLILIK